MEWAVSVTLRQIDPQQTAEHPLSPVMNVEILTKEIDNLRYSDTNAPSTSQLTIHVQFNLLQCFKRISIQVLLSTSIRATECCVL